MHRPSFPRNEIIPGEVLSASHPSSGILQPLLNIKLVIAAGSQLTFPQGIPLEKSYQSIQTHP